MRGCEKAEGHKLVWTWKVPAFGLLFLKMKVLVASHCLALMAASVGMVDLESSRHGDERH